MTADDLRALAGDDEAVEVVAHAINPVATHPQDRAWATQEARAAILALAEHLDAS